MGQTNMKNSKFWLHILLAILSLAGALCVAPVMLIAPELQKVVNENFGLPADHMEVAEALHPAAGPFVAADDDPQRNHARELARLDRAALFVEGDQKPFLAQWPVSIQQTGDCTSFALAHAIRDRICVQVAAGRRQKVVEPFPPYLYGAARRSVGAPHIPCGKNGSHPSYAVIALKKYGFITKEEAGQPYSGSLADRWGCSGPPSELMQLGKTRTGDYHRCLTADDVCRAICNGYPCLWGTSFRPAAYVERDGREVTSRVGSWAHAMEIVGYDGTCSTDPDRQYFLVRNSHPPTDHPEPLGDEPDSSFWITRKQLEADLKAPNSRTPPSGEVYAISDVSGFPADNIDWSSLDRLIKD
ncbi:hypothetical protein A6X21_09145 [Planctopirus hydrillae]|uniref:Peptidase C1A papain C-terminal domain-containing protein n=2 Tax=Planctopirus hydrillae TaxID=1841610 RepID=A0A1C3E7M5_9PLAN|nr:hypothetical protein A6X21_09145 [Planctopirus hydrillae]